MSYPVVSLPEINNLKEQLKEPFWVDYYRNCDAFKGSDESMDYLLKFLKKI